jgi:hypothetical protein
MKRKKERERLKFGNEKEIISRRKLPSPRWGEGKGEGETRTKGKDGKFFL